MSRRKQTTADILTILPTLEENQRFARVLGSRGKNIHEVQFSDDEILLVNLPPKFRNLVWVKRGSYVIIEPADETDKTKVAGDIVNVLFPDHIKKFKQEGIWPFQDQFSSTKDESGDDEEGEESDDDLFVNNNRPVMEESESETDSSDDEEEGNEEEATKN